MTLLRPILIHEGHQLYYIYECYTTYMNIKYMSHFRNWLHLYFQVAAILTELLFWDQWQWLGLKPQTSEIQGNAASTWSKRGCTPTLTVRGGKVESRNLWIHFICIQIWQVDSLWFWIVPNSFGFFHEAEHSTQHWPLIFSFCRCCCGCRCHRCCCYYCKENMQPFQKKKYHP